ncbi:MAG: heavy metal-responsive transcriptional regulator [Candidatus Promineifilaceae bacterium]|nr:heavy metal-responsive transcriptional regulator [Candidatus Promineifilaceae bacterium]
MKIGEVAKRTGLAESTIRYYEAIGVLPQPARLPNGYREYDAEDVQRLQFVAGARRCDLSPGDIREILSLRERGEVPCRAVLGLVEGKIAEVREGIRELERLEEALSELLRRGQMMPVGELGVCDLVSERAPCKQE